MNARQTRRIMWSGVGLIATAAALAAAYTAFRPCRLPTASDQPTQSAAPSGQQVDSNVPSLAAFESLGDLNLRRPLVDPPKAVVVPEPVKIPPLNSKLVGTMVEPGGSGAPGAPGAPGRRLAMFARPGDQLELKSVGEKTGEAEILQIDEGVVVVLYYGQQLTLKIDQGQDKR